MPPSSPHEPPVAPVAALDPNRVRQRRITEVLPQKLRQYELDAWLTFTREGAVDALGWDVAADRVVGRSACLFALREGQLVRVVLCASYDVTPFHESGLYDVVEPYKSEGIGPHLREWLGKLAPRKVAINFSRDCPNVDGITVGMYRYLLEIGGPGFESRLVSSEPLMMSVKGVKLPEEIAAIEEAAIGTQKILREAMSPGRITPGTTRELDVGKFLEQRTQELGFKVSFVAVMVGPDRGHADPTERVIQPGDLLRIDFGVLNQGYSSDIQRTAYFLRPGEKEPPPAVRKMWDVTFRANRAAIAAMKPGVKATEVDAAARKTIVDAGYDEYPHAAGHEIGIKVHDTGPVLGPDWKERYGTLVWHPLEVGQVFAVEPMIYHDIPEVGGVVQVGLEEDVVIEPQGARLMGQPQDNLWVL
ncbi:MAG: aminopeptidase P family protein [Deltaproteobacteria bacterium]|nr:aminopeptidase P family protein [Deltaproteobacteria bacterium]